MSKHHDPGAKLYEEVQARQLNTTWPDAMRNASSVDGLVFKGSTEATTLQRVGVAVFGALYVVVSIATMMIAWEQRSKFIGFMAFLELMLGAKVTSNAFIRRSSKPKNRHPHRIPSDPQ
jgi:hypothetical protein